MSQIVASLIIILQCDSNSEKVSKRVEREGNWLKYLQLKIGREKCHNIISNVGQIDICKSEKSSEKSF